MTNCEICNQELIHGEFEEKLGICVNCIMIECREDSYKSFFTLIAVILGGLLFTVASLVVISISVSIFLYSESFVFMIPPLTVCLIIAPGLIYLIFLKK
jgi:hypothetical protein